MNVTERKEDGDTRQLEYAEAIRLRYLKGDKKEKGKILSEFVKVTGYNRKSAIRLLKGGKVTDSGRPR